MKIKLFIVTLCFALCIAGGVAVAGKTINNLNQTNSSLQTELESTKKTYSGRIDELTEYQEGLVDKINVLQEKNQKLVENNQALQISYNELEETYNQCIQDNKLYVEKVNAQLAELKTTIANLESQANASSSENAELKAQIQELKTKVANLEKSIIEKNATIEQLNSTIDAQKTTIINLNKTIEDLNTTILDLTSDLNSDLNQLTFYKSLIEGTVTDITAADLNGVTKIRPYAFAQCSLSSVELPNTIVEIQRYAFYDCSLNNLDLSKCNLITELGTDVFRANTLISVLFPNSLRKIGSGCFAYCESLTSIVLPENIEILAENCFLSCSALSSIEINSYNIKDIGNNAFLNTPWWSKNVYLKNFIINNFIVKANSITELSNPNITALGYKFWASREVVFPSNFVIPDNIKYIGSGAFQGCNGFNSVTIPNTVEYIGDCAFSDCKLSSVNISTSVKYIGRQAFAGNSLTSVFIPISVDEMGYAVFSDNIEIYCECISDPEGFDSAWCANSTNVHYGYTYEQYLAAIGDDATGSGADS